MTTENFIVNYNDRCVWLVKRGTLTFWLNDGFLMFRVDPEGASSCLLTVQDALDVYTILWEFGKKLWEEAKHYGKYKKTIIQEAETFFSWTIGQEKLSVHLNNESDFLQISYTNTEAISLNVELISEIAQAIQIIIKQKTNMVFP